jgi:hypothetical protein
MPADKPSSSRNAPTSAAPGAAAAASQQASAGVDLNVLANVLRQIAASGGLPIQLSEAARPLIDTTAKLNAKPPVSVPFPPCADLLLSLITSTGPASSKDDITLYFEDYFRFERHSTLVDRRLHGRIDDALLKCIGEQGWPPGCCVCEPCVTLRGSRNGNTTTPASLRRLFVGDVLFVFHWEWVFQVLGVILSDYATHGRLPISNGSLPDGGPRDDIAALVLETMVQQTNAGASSRVRDRDATSRRTLGLTSEHGRKLDLDAQANTRLCTLFHAFLHHASQFYDARRIAVAIRGSAAPAPPPSVATLTMIGDIVRSMGQLFEAFHYGRNYYNTLNALVWLIAGMSVVREIRTTLGIPPAFNKPHEYLEAAHSILVKKKNATGSEVNLYSISRELARNGRDLLLDLEVLDADAPNFTNVNGDLENWLTQVEPKVESYRTAYRQLTGIDLGTALPSAIPAQA